MSKLSKKIKIFIIVGIVLIIFFIIFFIIKVKNNKIGNNIVSQEKINIMELKSYTTEIEVTIKSNKTENKYKIKQIYNIENDKEKNIQKIMEPEEMKGIQIIKEGDKVILKNSKLNLEKTFENCKDLENNDYDLEVFVQDFKQNLQESNVEENEEEKILNTVQKSENKYIKYKTLYVNKKTGIPTKMEIKDINKNITVYIVYNKAEIK